MEQEMEGKLSNEMEEEMFCKQTDQQKELLQPEVVEQEAEQPEAATERQQEVEQPEAATEQQEVEQPETITEQRQAATEQQQEVEQPEAATEQQEVNERQEAEQPQATPEQQEEDKQPQEDQAAEAEAEQQRKEEERQKAEESHMLLKNVEAEQERIKNLLLRLDRRFDAEILNAQNRDTQVRAFYNELQEHKAGLVEKYMKNVLYDIADMRESIKKQAKRLKDRGEDSISLEEFLEYGEDLKSILEKYEVNIYHGQTGVPIDALHQKIARKVETQEEALGKTVAESLSDGYEYNKKVIYPEKISVYVYKPGEKKEEQ